MSYHLFAIARGSLHEARLVLQHPDQLSAGVAYKREIESLLETVV